MNIKEKAFQAFKDGKITLNQLAFILDQYDQAIIEKVNALYENEFTGGGQDE